MSDAEARQHRPTLAVATIGHHHHGKTTLTSAITHVLARRTQGETKPISVVELDRRAGFLRWAGDVHGDPPDGHIETITVRGCEIRYATERRDFVHIDSPGRRPWLKNAARSQALVDGLILVVSAPEGVEPQTHEHLLLARALGHTQVVVFVNQCDRVTDMEWIDLVEHDVRELLGKCGFDGDGTRIIRGAALPVCSGDQAWEPAIRDLLDALDHEFAPPQPAPDGPPLVYIDHVFSARVGVSGPIIDGRIARGQIRRGDTLALVGFGETVRVQVMDLETNRRKIAEAGAGSFVGLALARPGAHLSRYDLRSGQALVELDTPSVRRITVQFELFATEVGGRRGPIVDGHIGLFLFGVVVVSGRVRLAEPSLQPGASATVRVELWAPVYLEPGMVFLFRDGNQGPLLPRGQPARWAGTAGMGRVLSIDPVTT